MSRKGVNQKRQSKIGQKLVRNWSEIGQKMFIITYELIRNWSKFGQKLIKNWSNFGQNKKVKLCFSPQHQNIILLITARFCTFFRSSFRIRKLFLQSKINSP